MNSQWFSAITLIAALVIGYGVIVGRDDGDLDANKDEAIVLGYYLKNAVITETAPDGAPQVRFAADNVTQNLEDNTVTLSVVRIDYVQRSDDNTFGPGRWVLNADHATTPAEGQRAAREVELRGNVQAESVGAPHSSVLRTESLDVDIGRQTARTDQDVDVSLDGYGARGHGMTLDMKRDHVQLQSDVVLRLAAQPTAAITPSKPMAKLSLPELFESDALELKDNVLVLTKVRSVSPPYVSADQARATGADLANNQVVLTGSVRMELPDQGVVTADAATVTVRDDRVVRAVITGAPVNLEHRPKDATETVYGRASNIDYDVPEQTVLFTGDAWFTKGEYEFKSDSILYNLSTQAVRAGPGSIGLGPRKDQVPEIESKKD